MYINMCICNIYIKQTYLRKGDTTLWAIGTCCGTCESVGIFLELCIERRQNVSPINQSKVNS
jgi:hypothetical protein